MSAPTTNEKSDNELIAEFMGNRKLVTRDDGMWIIGGQGMLMPNNFEYDTSWDWLMPVVEKIESIGDFQISIYTSWKGLNEKDGAACRITGSGLAFGILHAHGKRIDMTYKSVVEFIKWYNTQTQPK